MAHEITSSDNVVLHHTGAWHGLGVVVQDAPTPAEALKLASLDWTVEQWPLYATCGERRIVCEDNVLNVRSDNAAPLGIVGVGYKPVQNAELADFCTALAEASDVVKVETAGSIRGGRKVWFLLKGESFSVRNADAVTPYILASNGHDGTAAIRLTPTTIRVVCSNTLHMVIPSFDPESGKASRAPVAASFVARHTGDMASKIEDAKKALELYGKSLDKSREVIDRLAAKDVSSESVKRFFLEMHVKHFGAIADAPSTTREHTKRREALAAVAAMVLRFDSELDLAGATAWNAMNAYTGWLQHDRKSRKGSDSVNSVFFGAQAEQSLEALGAALSL